MAYKITVDSIRKVQEYLNILYHNKLPVLELHSDAPSQLATFIHQGMAAAAKLEYPRYKELRAAYRISVEKDRLICKKKFTILDGPHAKFDEAIELLDILDLWIANKATGLALQFPKAEKSSDLLSWLTTIPHLWDGNVLVLNPPDILTSSDIKKEEEKKEEEKDVL